MCQCVCVMSCWKIICASVCVCNVHNSVNVCRCPWTVWNYAVLGNLDLKFFVCLLSSPGQASLWCAQRVREEPEFKSTFDALESVQQGEWMHVCVLCVRGKADSFRNGWALEAERQGVGVCKCVFIWCMSVMYSVFVKSLRARLTHWMMCSNLRVWCTACLWRVQEHISCIEWCAAMWGCDL